MAPADKRKRTKSAATATVKAGGGMSDKEILALARQAVPPRMHATARVVRAAPGRALAKKEGPDLAAQVADLVGAKLPPDDPGEVVVQFTDETELGKRYRMVHIRGGKVTNVVTRAARR
jgi:hypothetical protein